MENNSPNNMALRGYNVVRPYWIGANFHNGGKNSVKKYII